MTSLLSRDFVKPVANQLSILVKYYWSVGSFFNNLKLK